MCDRHSSRRELLRSIPGVASAVAGLALAGCATLGSSHHRPHLYIDNEASAAHEVSLTVTDESGTLLDDRNLTVRSGETVAFEEFFPNPGEDLTVYEVTISIAGGATKTHEQRRSPGDGSHSLWITITSSSTISISGSVH